MDKRFDVYSDGIVRDYINNTFRNRDRLYDIRGFDIQNYRDFPYSRRPLHGFTCNGVDILGAVDDVRKDIISPDIYNNDVSIKCKNIVVTPEQSEFIVYVMRDDVRIYVSYDGTKSVFELTQHLQWKNKKEERYYSPSKSAMKI